MLLDFAELTSKYRLAEKVTGVIHGGAHLAEEAGDYNQLLGPHVPVWWIEANPEVFFKIGAVLAPYPHQKLIEGLLCDTDGEERSFNVTNNDGMSSSIYWFGTHPTFSPETVFTHQITPTTRTLDSIVAQYEIKANMLVMDIQGAEGLALAGAKELLPTLDFVMLEVNRDEVYIGCSKVWDLDDVLLKNGLTRRETHWVGTQGWGDAWWTR